MINQDNIINKLHLYEFLGYLIPGSVFVFILLFALNLIDFKIKLKIENEFIGFILYFAGIYFIGIVLHEISNLTESHELKKLWNGFPSTRFLLKNETLISEHDKKLCWKYAREHFSMKINLKCPKNESEKRIRSFSHQIYMKFRAYIKELGIPEVLLNESEMFNIHYGMCRNFLATSLISIIMFGTMTIYLILQHKSYLLSLVLAFAFYGISWLLYRRTKRFADYHLRSSILAYINKHHSHANSNP